MKDYWYCEDCNELIHKDNVSNFDGNDACPYCRADLENHSEDYEEGDELYEAVKECERLEREREGFQFEDKKQEMGK
jgi:hypothetical protein